MPQNLITRCTLLALCMAAVGLAACVEAHPFVRSGGEQSVDVGYSGDVNTARALAERHCAGFDRVPRLVDASTDTAYYRCVPR